MCGQRGWQGPKEPFPTPTKIKSKKMPRPPSGRRGRPGQSPPLSPELRRGSSPSSRSHPEKTKQNSSPGAVLWPGSPAGLAPRKGEWMRGNPWSLGRPLCSASRRAPKPPAATSPRPGACCQSAALLFTSRWPACQGSKRWPWARVRQEAGRAVIGGCPCSVAEADPASSQAPLSD